MCGCSSNFDGTSGIEEMEKRVFLDFDGEDDDFDGFFAKKGTKKLTANEKLNKRVIRLGQLEVIKSILFNYKTLQELNFAKPKHLSLPMWEDKIGKYISAINTGINNEGAFRIVYPYYDELIATLKRDLEIRNGRNLTVDEVKNIALGQVKANDTTNSTALMKKIEDRPKVLSSTASTKPVSKPKADAIKNDVEVKGAASTKPVSKPKSDAIKDDVEVKGAVDTTDADDNKKADDIRVKNINENFFLRNKTSLMIGGGVLLALGIGFIVYRKLKK